MEKKTSGLQYVDHQRLRELALSHEVLVKKRIYLDLKYWIYCRDAKNNQPSVPAHRTIYDLIHGLVVDGVAICPIDEVVVTELFKQENADRRMAMGRLIDELSLGVCLKPLLDRVREEILRFLYRTMLPQLPLEDRGRLIWTRPGFILGWFVPEIDGLSVNDNGILADSFVNHVWQMSTSQVLAQFAAANKDLSELRSDYQNLAVRINAGNSTHQEVTARWRDVYDDEVKGVFNAFADIIWEGLKYFRSRHPDVFPEPPHLSDQQEHEQMAGVLAAAFIAKRLWREFPTAHIFATLHARIRRDHQRRMKPNDFEDFHHASAALPYCDVFLTENSLSTLLNSGSPSLVKQFGVTVISDIDDVIDWLRTLAKSGPNPSGLLLG